MMEPARSSMLSYWLKHPEDLLEMQRLQMRNRYLREHGSAEELEALLLEVRDFLNGMAARMK